MDSFFFNMKSINMKFLVLLILLSCVQFAAISQQKKAISFKDFDSWKDIENPIISDDGKWISFEINPQKGDGYLYIRNNKTGKKDSVSRGYDAKFSSGGEYLVFKIKSLADTIRKAKIAKKKDDDLPKDSLGIYFLLSGKIKKFQKLKSFKLAKEVTSDIVFLAEKEKPAKKDSLESKDNASPQDTTKAKSMPKTKKEKTKKKDKKTDTGTLYIVDYLTQDVKSFNDVLDYSISENGAKLGFCTLKKDTVDSCSVVVYDFKSKNSKVQFKEKGHATKITIDNKGNQFAFVYSADTVKNKVFSLHYFKENTGAVSKLVDTLTEGIQKGWSVSDNGDMYFSKNTSKLFFNLATRPDKEPKDTVPDDEKFKLDLWSWRDSVLQPNQLVNLEKDAKKSFPAVYRLSENKAVQLGDINMPYVTVLQKGDLDIGLGFSYSPYAKLVSWISNAYKDVFLVDLKTGSRKILLQKTQAVASISPNGKYVAWYEFADSTWNAHILSSGKNVCLTKEIKAKFFDEENDLPGPPDPYGIVGWINDDKSVLIYDKFDIWICSPEGKEKFKCLTGGFGRKANIKFRYVQTDKDALFVESSKPLLLKSSNETTKQEGFFKVEFSKTNPVELINGNYRFTSLVKAKNSENFVWRKGNFNEFPDVWFSDSEFKKAEKVSNANPQQSNYLWGTVELVKWTSFKGTALEGLLYKPEGFSKEKKYPMIVYFYEKNSDQLFQHYSPKPSRSVINITEYVSNGYMVFIPDIVYKESPGADAYDAIVSGTQHIVSLGGVNSEKIGLQGQSWGGYQVAHLVTRTNMYKAAMAGAAVCNMTSAYGGIRWTSGNSRMMQYEEGQSRIGGTLWSHREKFIENSPLFFADKVETPLLLMNNDADGAVPWYQGIEFFLALRRLDKKVWLLNYNGDDHNIKRRANAMDLNIRMKQFFDHYLKNEPAPEWMINGIPASKKGKLSGYDFVR